MIETINPDILQEGSYDEYYEELDGMFMIDNSILESKDAVEDILNGESYMELVDIVSNGEDDEEEQDED